MDQYYSVPSQYNGMSLSQIQSKTGTPFRADLLGGALGINPNAPLNSGTIYTLGNGNLDNGSAEYKALNSIFSPSQSPQAKATQDTMAAANATAQQNEQNLFKTEENKLTNFTTNFNTAVPQIISSTSTKYNLPALSGIADALNSRISELTGNTNNAGAGGFASSDQVDKAVNTNYIPRYNTAEQNFLNANQAAQTEENQLLTPFTTNATLLGNEIASEMTGFTSTQDQELQGLLGALESGNQLTEEQMQTANNLAVAKLNFEAASQKVLQPGENLVNGSNGKTLATNGNLSSAISGALGNNGLTGMGSAGSGTTYSPSDYTAWLSTISAPSTNKGVSMSTLNNDVANGGLSLSPGLNLFYPNAGGSATLNG